MRRRRVRPRRGVVPHRQFAESAEPAEQARVGDRRIGGELGGREREGRRRSPGRRDEGDGQGHLQDLRPRSESLLFQSSSSSSSWSRHVSSRFAFGQRVCCRSPPPPTRTHSPSHSLSLSNLLLLPSPLLFIFFFFFVIPFLLIRTRRAVTTTQASSRPWDIRARPREEARPRTTSFPRNPSRSKFMYTLFGRV
jgi:hypothetical protein